MRNYIQTGWKNVFTVRFLVGNRAACLNCVRGYALLSLSSVLIHLQALLCTHALSHNAKNYIAIHTKSNHSDKNAMLEHFFPSPNWNTPQLVECDCAFQRIRMWIMLICQQSRHRQKRHRGNWKNAIQCEQTGIAVPSNCA